jgi:hypothetical protein
MNDEPRIEYIEARRVLLDALGALSQQLDAVVLVGAQAVYLRTADRLPAYQPFTTDADIVLTAEPGIWEARFRREGFVDDVVVPVDLIVPMHVAAGSGRRSARLGGEHGKNSARKSEGLEGALVDHSPIRISAIDPTDDRVLIVNVAGEASLLVAKLHKLGDRLEKPERLAAKDAGDVYRLFDIVSPDEMATRLVVLLADERSAPATLKALDYGDVLFGAAGSTGVRLGVEALRTTIPEATSVPCSPATGAPCELWTCARHNERSTRAAAHPTRSPARHHPPGDNGAPSEERRHPDEHPQQRQRPRSLTWAFVLYLVAGTGFEPVTFGL